jgi:hypothetical protein
MAVAEKKGGENKIQRVFSSRLGVCRHCGHPFLLPPRVGGLLRSSYSKPCPKCGKPVKVKL